MTNLHKTAGTVHLKECYEWWFVFQHQKWRCDPEGGESGHGQVRQQRVWRDLQPNHGQSYPTSLFVFATRTRYFRYQILLNWSLVSMHNKGSSSFADNLESEAETILKRTEALKPRIDKITDHLEVRLVGHYYLSCEEWFFMVSSAARAWKVEVVDCGRDTSEQRWRQRHLQVPRRQQDQMDVRYERRPGALHQRKQASSRSRPLQSVQANSKLPQYSGKEREPQMLSFGLSVTRVSQTILAILHLYSEQ